MRVGIDARRLHSGRGMDRYVCELVSGLAEVAPGDMEFVLFTGADVAPAHVRLPGRCTVEPCGQRLRALYRTHLGPLLSWRFRDLDIFHFPTNDVWYSRYCPTVVTLHDVIPLKHPDWFFRTTDEERRYRAHLRHIRENAAVITTTTEFTRQDIHRHLEYPMERIVMSSDGVDTERFRPDRTVAARVMLADRIGINAPYLLYLGAIEPKKNVHRIVEAYLAADVSPHLLLVGPVAGRWRLYVSDIEARIQACRASQRIRFCGPVYDDTLLRALYSCAVAFVFPSIEEGFGLPVLEALACGTAVITSSTSSLPEVAGDAAVLVDPEDTEALTRVLARLVGDPALRDGLCARAVQQAKRFTWTRVAQLTLRAYPLALSA